MCLAIEPWVGLFLTELFEFFEIVGASLTGALSPGVAMTTTEKAPAYGTRAWFKKAYRSTPDDPWGLSWRLSQLVRYDLIVKILKRHVPGKESSLGVLDIGCATGDFASTLSSALGMPGGRLIAVDFSEEAIFRARKKYLDVDFRVMSIDAVGAPFRDSMDVITCMEVLYYLDDIQRKEALENMKNALKEGGLLLVSSRISRSPYFQKDELREFVAAEFDIVEAGEIHVGFMGGVEKFVMRVNKLFYKLGLGNPTRLLRRIIPTTNIRLGKAIEKVSRLCGPITASHAYVLARKRSNLHRAEIRLRRLS
ncbi:MAG: class I SAM-dependent methyltransferase [Gammaproteobacteria bacterium]|nr:class I SAM-dependent methyltransferase [Gammaproteobacteria bacterium]